VDRDQVHFTLPPDQVGFIEPLTLVEPLKNLELPEFSEKYQVIGFLLSALQIKERYAKWCFSRECRDSEQRECMQNPAQRIA
jgi:hypothetical protein